MLQNSDEPTYQRFLRKAKKKLQDASDRVQAAWFYWVATSHAFHVVLDRTGPRRIHVEAFLRHMANYCYAYRSTVHKDPHAMGIAEGRRQAYLLMLHLSSLSDEESYAIYHGRTIEK